MASGGRTETPIATERKAPLRWRVEAVSPLCTTIRIDLNPPERECWCLLRSDAHHDSPCTDRLMEKRHLDQARERGAMIFDGGDLFDAMGGPHDKRRSAGGVEDEDKVDDYYDRLLLRALEFYGPYAANFAVLATGNHETSVVKNAGTDLTGRLARELRERLGSPVVRMGYRGWVKFQVNVKGTQNAGRKMYFIHGSGGGGYATKGSLQGHRRQATVDADIIVSGHIHESLNQSRCRLFLSDGGVESIREVKHIQVPSYKNEHVKAAGWAIEKELDPKPVGATWLKFSRINDKLIVETFDAR